MIAKNMAHVETHPLLLNLAVENAYFANPFSTLLFINEKYISTHKYHFSTSFYPPKNQKGWVFKERDGFYFLFKYGRPEMLNVNYISYDINKGRQSNFILGMYPSKPIVPKIGFGSK